MIDGEEGTQDQDTGTGGSQDNQDKTPPSPLDTLYGNKSDDDQSDDDNQDDDGEGADDTDGDDTSSSDDGQDGDDDGETITSLRQLTEHFETGPDWAQNLKVEVKVDGKTSEVPISELVKNHQINAAAEGRLEEAKAKVKAVNEELAEKTKAFEGSLAEVAAMIAAAEQMLEIDEKAVDWAKLRDEDEGAYAAKRADFADRKNKIAAMRQKAVETWDGHTKKQQEERTAKMKDFVAREADALIKALPDWGDETKAKAAKTELTEYLTKSSGYKEEEISSVFDHRFIVLANKAMLYDRAKTKKSDPQKKRVRKPPKVLKPGSGDSKSGKPKKGDHVGILYR